MKKALQRLFVFSCLLLTSLAIDHSHANVDQRLFKKDLFLVHGVIDRFEGEDYAVVLLEEWRKEIVVPVCELPIGSEESTWLIITMYRNFINVIAIDEQRTTLEQSKAVQLREKLKGQR